MEDVSVPMALFIYVFLKLGKANYFTRADSSFASWISSSHRGPRSHDVIQAREKTPGDNPARGREAVTA